MSKKGKKEKITYVDDGRTIADMSNVGSKRNKNKSTPRLQIGKGTPKEQASTFFSAMKMMFVPMLVVLGIIAVLYMLMSFLALLLY